MQKKQDKQNPGMDYKFLKTFSYQRPQNYVAIPFIEQQKERSLVSSTNILRRKTNKILYQKDFKKSSYYSQTKTDNSLHNMLQSKNHSQHLRYRLFDLTGDQIRNNIIPPSKNNQINQKFNEPIQNERALVSEYFSQDVFAKKIYLINKIPQNSSESVSSSVSRLSSLDNISVSEFPSTRRNQLAAIKKEPSLPKQKSSKLQLLELQSYSQEHDSQENEQLRKNFLKNQYMKNVEFKKKIKQLMGDNNREAYKHTEGIKSDRTSFSDNVDLPYQVQKFYPIKEESQNIPEEKFLELIHRMDIRENENFVDFKKRVDEYFLESENQNKKFLKKYLEQNQEILMKKNMRDRRDNLNKILSVIQQPNHLNKTLQDQCTKEKEEKKEDSNKSFKNLDDDYYKQFSKADMEKTVVELDKLIIPKANQRVKPTMRQIRLSLRNTLLKLKRLKINPKELMKNTVFSNKPFQKEGSYNLIQAAKLNNLELAKEMLLKNKYLVYDFDHAYLTALHWSAKRGFIKMVKLLLQNGADPDSKDIVGRTPTFLAASYHYPEILQLMLYYQADPWSNQSMKYDFAVKNNKRMQILLQNCRKVHILLKMTHPAYRDLLWKKESLIFHVDPESQQQDKKNQQ